MNVHLLKDRRCQGCGAIGYVETRTLFCCYCFGLCLAVAERKKKLNAKLDSTVRQRFAKKAIEVSLKLKEFNSIGEGKNRIRKAAR